MIPVFKIHASQIGKIMGGALGKPTEKQMARLKELEEKKETPKGLTAIQQTELTDLIAKRDAKPTLQDGAKTYCKGWLKEQADLYDRVQSFSNKYTKKGETCEPSGIDLTKRIMGYGEIFKNTRQYENDFIIGTPDLILKLFIEDIKCSWDEQTFPLFDIELPQKDYWWQGQGYMDLLNKGKHAVNYCLIDTPTELIDKAAFYRAKSLGMDDVPMELWDKVCAEMTYPDVPDYLKFNRFEFDRDDIAIKAVHEQVKLCREYITNELMPIVELRKKQYQLQSA